jgi:hypothetical protein
MHGKIVCKKCGKILAQCRCFKSCENIVYDLCEECKNKE